MVGDGAGDHVVAASCMRPPRTLAAARERAVDARLRLALARVEVERLVGGEAAEGDGR